MITPRASDLELPFAAARPPPPAPRKLHSHPNSSGTISRLMHIYFGCIMLIRKPFTRYRGRYKNKETAWKLQRLCQASASSCDTVKRKTKRNKTKKVIKHRAHVTTLVQRVERLNKNSRVDSKVTVVAWISSDASSPSSPFHSLRIILC